MVDVAGHRDRRPDPLADGLDHLEYPDMTAGAGHLDTVAGDHLLGWLSRLAVDLDVPAPARRRSFAPRREQPHRPRPRIHPHTHARRVTPRARLRPHHAPCREGP